MNMDNPIQVKMYTAYSALELEKRINADLKRVDETTEIIDIKYAIKSGSQYISDIEVYSAMIIFR